MATNTVQMIYIGNLAPIDNDETDWDTDNAGAIAGTYHAFSDLQVVDVENNDANNDGIIYDDEAGSGDSVSYTLGGTNYSHAVDASIIYSAQVIEDDGTVHNIEVLVIQTVNGDTFVNDKDNAGAMDNLTIRSIELIAPVTTSAAGYYTDRNVQNSTVCFAAGTLLETVTGPRRIETLVAGDTLVTRDNGPQTIRWIGSMRLIRPGPLAPIRIPAGALGHGVPARTLRLSPQHRIMVTSVIARRMFDCPDVLVPAVRLIALPGILRDPPDRPVRYWHVLCDAHEIVSAEGAPAETLFPGPEVKAALPATSWQEIELLIGPLPPSNRHVRSRPGGYRSG